MRFKERTKNKDLSLLNRAELVIDFYVRFNVNDFVIGFVFQSATKVSFKYIALCSFTQTLNRARAKYATQAPVTLGQEDAKDT